MRSMNWSPLLNRSKKSTSNSSRCRQHSCKERTLYLKPQNWLIDSQCLGFKVEAVVGINGLSSSSNDCLFFPPEPPIHAWQTITNILQPLFPDVGFDHCKHNAGMIGPHGSAIGIAIGEQTNGRKKWRQKKVRSPGFSARSKRKGESCNIFAGQHLVVPLPVEISLLPAKQQWYGLCKPSIHMDNLDTFIG